MKLTRVFDRQPQEKQIEKQLSRANFYYFKCPNANRGTHKHNLGGPHKYIGQLAGEKLRYDFNFIHLTVEPRPNESFNTPNLP